MSNNYWEYLAGRWYYRKEIAKNYSCKILVVLHLYYMDSWPTIQKYLRNLRPYKYDLIITYIPQQANEKILAQIKQFKPDTQFFACANKGWDIAPFLEVISKQDLLRYDIVYKLHTKGTTRKFIYIYNQIFKKKDWFTNLYDGILGGFSVHRTINRLCTHPTTGLVAAKNLIIQDPKHKQTFTAAYAQRLHIPITQNYHFVAGTCFAMKAALLEQVKTWPVHMTDFTPTKRGEGFSLAHALERMICAFIEPLGYSLYGQPTPHPLYSRQLKRYQKYTALRLLDDPRVKIDYEFFYKWLEGGRIVYEIKHLALREIKREWQGQILHLQDTHAYQYLEGNSTVYNEYCAENERISGICMSETRFKKLIHSLQNGYDETYMPVVRGEDYVLQDGQHRCCWLLKKYGPDYKIPVLCITDISALRWDRRIKRYLKKTWQRWKMKFNKINI